MGAKRAPLHERFWRYVDKRGDDECWPWTGTNVRGRGTLSIGWNKPRVYAPRVSWEIHNGRLVPDGMFACHSCDNPNCVNPRHIWIGTPSENMQDMLSKGRAHWAARTHCCRGHEYTPENTRMYRGHRRCIQCSKDKAREWRERQAA